MINNIYFTCRNIRINSKIDHDLFSNLNINRTKNSIITLSIDNLKLMNKLTLCTCLQEGYLTISSKNSKIKHIFTSTFIKNLLDYLINNNSNAKFIFEIRYDHTFKNYNILNFNIILNEEDYAYILLNILFDENVYNTDSEFILDNGNIEFN